MKYIATCLLLVGLGMPALAADPYYPASAIPEALKKNAHSVVRLDETTYRYISPKEIRYVHHQVVTILDREADHRSDLSFFYSSLRELRSVTAAYYDASGKLVKKMRQSDMLDLPAGDDISLISDSRGKKYTFTGFGYPYTIEFEEEYKCNSGVYLGRWSPYTWYDEPVEKAVCNVVMPAGYDLRYRLLQSTLQPEIADVKEGKSYTWSMTNLAPMRRETKALAIHERYPYLLLAPSEAKYGDAQGKFSNWQELGNFFYAINKGRDVLPDALKAKVHAIADPLKTQPEKVAALYKYLQQNYRYISISLGVGGMQTIDAITTARTSYGDCKGLSNLMCAMLKEVGIKGYAVLVNADDEPMRIPEDFATDWFNHVIAMVPNGKDTTWLECTSNMTPPGYLGSFTADRAVLIMDETNSKLVHTPVYTQADNKRFSTTNAMLDEKGFLKATTQVNTSGILQDDKIQMIHLLSKEKQMEYLRRTMEISSFDITSYNTEIHANRLPDITETFELTANNYASVTGKRLFLKPNITNRMGSKVETDTARTSAIDIPYGEQYADTVNITLPAGYKVETLPKPVSVETKFGTYTSAVNMKDNTVTYIRKYLINSGRFPAADYSAFATFMNSVYKAERNTLVLVKE
ncbi:DUF3857 domain-containing protein [Chitinophaga sp. sic0106]|uniref:DUF3857 domain-containing protein n=1 Tax=Chitinophaga sp. sic0106 TaxID=2854785 RepID=UPI001C45719A|nr:DUF3857 domain-containing protein [Chitinophaga sp. sic0106]MBV7531483.1 DUF3857 domain-containing protein [Chitinophaga sp. sic0106]